MIIFLNNKFKASLGQIKYCLNNNSNKDGEIQPPNNGEITSLLPIELIPVISSGGYNHSPTMITTFPTRRPMSLANHSPLSDLHYLLSLKRLEKTNKTTKWCCYALASSHFLVSVCLFVCLFLFLFLLFQLWSCYFSFQSQLFQSHPSLGSSDFSLYPASSDQLLSQHVLSVLFSSLSKLFVSQTCWSSWIVEDGPCI